MNSYFIEVGENSNASVCKCCNEKSSKGHGFVYKNSDAYAVYYAGWSEAHDSKKVTLALALGEWGESSTTNDRTCIGLEAFETEHEIQFRVIDPDESPWPNTELMGSMLCRDKALAHPLLQEVFLISEEIIRNHSALKKYLNASIV